MQFKYLPDFINDSERQKLRKTRSATTCRHISIRCRTRSGGAAGFASSSLHLSRLCRQQQRTRELPGALLYLLQGWTALVALAAVVALIVAAVAIVVVAIIVVVGIAAIVVSVLPVTVAISVPLVVLVATLVVAVVSVATIAAIVVVIPPIAIAVIAVALVALILAVYPLARHPFIAVVVAGNPRVASSGSLLHIVDGYARCGRSKPDHDSCLRLGCHRGYAEKACQNDCAKYTIEFHNETSFGFSPSCLCMFE